MNRDSGILWFCAAVFWAAFFFLGCGGELQFDCPAPDISLASRPDAVTIHVPDGCVCDAPLMPALLSDNSGWCSYTWQRTCDGCAIDVTWAAGHPPK